MNRKIYGDVGSEIDKRPDRSERITQWSTEILAPVRREKDGPKLWKIGRRRRL